MDELPSVNCNRYIAGQRVISNCIQSTTGPPVRSPRKFRCGATVIIIIIIMAIFKCYFSREHIALSYKKWCEHRIKRNQQIKSTVDKYVLHPLSCRLRAGRLPRHSALNDINKRALSSAGFIAVLEPVGVGRGEGKRPDGMKVYPFPRGKSIIWNSTCVDSFPPSAFAMTAIEPGSTACSAEVRKISKYEGLCDRYIFQAVVIESSGAIRRDTDGFLSSL